MPNTLELTVDIPKGIEITIDGNKVTVKGSKGQLEREFKNAQITINKKEDKIVVSTASKSRRYQVSVGTVRAHIKNMIIGVTKGVSYKLKVVYSHFPMNVKVQGNNLVIDNFLGEKYPRRILILDKVKVDVKGQDITVTGIDKEKVSQTAANIEQITRIRDFDPRVFQDGIYLVEKDGKPLK